MANRNVKVVLQAEVGQYEANMRKAEASTKQLGATATDTGSKNEQASKKSAQAAAEHAAAVEKTGKMLAGFGTVAVAGLGMAAKAAIGWEADWTGVMKTVEGTPEQLGAVEDGLRGLAKELPASHTEIAAVAQAAGQLGIATPDVVSFTKTMIDMGESTNLSAEEAATTLARFSNVMGTSTSDVGRLGATIVGLGNNFATTESEIAALAQRLSGAGAQAGLTEADVLGISAAMSSVGIEAEAGGTAMSLTMKRIGKAVDDGGDKLQLFASVAGMTTEEFAAAWRDDAGAALTTFVGGLSEAGASGESLNAILAELGITGIRESDALLRLSAAGDLMGDAMTRAGEEWTAGTALVEEAAKRYETTEAQISMAWNAIKDAAIDAGAVMLPMIAGVAETVADLAGVFSSLPAPVQGGITALGGLVGVAALAGGGFLLLLPKLRESSEALRTLGRGGEIADAGLRKVGKGAVVAGAIAGVGLALAKIVESDYMSKIDDGMGRVTLALTEVANEAPGAAAGLDELFQNIDGEAITGEVDNIDEALRRTFDKSAGERFNDFGEKWINAATGIEGSSQILAGSWERVDKGLADMVTSNNAEGAKKAFEEIEKAAEKQGITVEQLAAIFPEYGDALHGASAAQADAASSGEAVEESLADVGLAADGAVESLTDYLDSLFAAGLATQSVMQAQSSYQQSLEGVDEALKQMRESEEDMGNILNKSKDAFDLTSDAGRLAQDTFLGIADAGRGMATAMADAGESQDEIQDSLKGTYNDLIDAGEQFGLTAEQAKTLARDVLGVPEGVHIDSWMEDQAQVQAEQLTATVDDVPDFKEVSVVVSDDGAIGQIEITKEQLESIQDRTVGVEVTDNGTVMTVQGGIDNVDGKTEYIYVEDNGTARVVQQRINNVSGKTEYVYVDDNGTVQVVQGKINGVQDGSADITAIPYVGVAEAALNNTARNRTSTITQVFKRSNLLGNTSPGGPVKDSAAGGRLSKHASGGRLPLTGPGTDKQDGILGISSLTGEPTSYVDKGEWIINGRMSERYNAELAAINAGTFPKVQGYANGDRLGRQYAAGELAYSASGGTQINAEELGAAVAKNIPRTIQYRFGDVINPIAEPLSMTVKRNTQYSPGDGFE